MNVTLADVARDCALILPELTLVATLCLILLWDAALPLARSRRMAWPMIGGLGLALLLVLIGYGKHPVLASPGPVYAFSGMIVVDKLGDFFKVVFLLGTLGVVLFTLRSTELKDYRQGEYYTLMLGAVLGGAFLASSNNLLMLVLSLETLSLCSYVLVGYVKHDRLSAEASLKYILYGAVASAVMLFGVSYIYGMAGTLDLSRVFHGLASGEDNGLAVLIAFVLVIGGLGFKMAAVPFHFWAPDVYQGAPTPITAFLSVVSKAAGFAALLRVFLPLFAVEGAVIPDNVLAIRGALLTTIQDAHLALLFWILSVATMTLGNLVAIVQKDVKRLLAYSSIAHAGYILMGMTVFNNAALEAMLFYFFVYLFMNLGAWLVVVVLREVTGSSELSAYRGLAWRNPFLFTMMFIFLISLTGIPPTAGFLGKLQIFYVVVGAGLAEGLVLSPASMFYISLAIIGGINTAISLYFYMRIAKVMVFDRPEAERPLRLPAFDSVSLAAYGAPVLLLILIYGPAFTVVELFPR